MMDMRFIDLHCDTMTVDCENILQSWQGHVNLDKLRQGGALAQFFALFIPTHEHASKVPGGPFSPCECFQHFYGIYRREMDANAEFIAPALNLDDLSRNQSEGKISSILTVEDGEPLDGDITRIDEFYEKGVRLLTLTWNFENCLGYPHSPDPDAMALGLKPFGIEAVRRMNELGMVVDVSHLSDGGVRDVAAHSSAPFVASHSCARALCDHTRCLSDALLRLLADHGGVVGLNFHPLFLKPNGTLTTVDNLVRHALHIRDKAGIDALALGSDFDGLPADSLEFADYSGMPRLAAALEKHFSSAEMDKLCSANALRVLRDVWK